MTQRLPANALFLLAIVFALVPRLALADERAAAASKADGFVPKAIEMRVCKTIIHDNTRNWFVEKIAGLPDLYTIVEAKVIDTAGTSRSVIQKIELPRASDNEVRCTPIALTAYSSEITGSLLPIQVDISLKTFVDHKGLRNAGEALGKAAESKGETGLAKLLAKDPIGALIEAVGKLGLTVVGAALTAAGDDEIASATKSYTSASGELGRPFGDKVLTFLDEKDVPVQTSFVFNVIGDAGPIARCDPK